MLERGRLLIRTAGPTDGHSIEDADTGETLGTARRVRRSSWLPQLCVLEVRETDDAPLVFTVERAWSLSARYVVRDAEGRPIGSLSGPVVEGPGKYLFAVFEADGGVYGKSGIELARVSRTGTGTAIAFTDAVDPYVKMLLLAAVLRP
jgi:hypothetical protein